MLGEVFMQQRNGELIELASQPDRSSGTAGIPDLERARIGFPERCHCLLQAYDWADLKRLFASRVVGYAGGKCIKFRAPDGYEYGQVGM